MACTEDWQSCKSALECNKYMLENEIACDVQFSLISSTGEPVRMRAHKFILISRSPVFFAMFSGPLAEKSDDIKVTDICHEAFAQLLRYLYFEDVELTEESVLSVLYAAKKYLVSSLTKICIIYLESILTHDNVCQYLENVFLFEEEATLIQQCSTLVRQQSKNVFRSEGFLHISKQTLCKLLRTEILSVHEVDVFKACLGWAEIQCQEKGMEPSPENRRQVLGDAIKLLHLPALSLNEFTKIIVPAGILSTQEENMIFRYLLQNGEEARRSNAVVDDFPFPTGSRECVEARCDVAYEGFIKHASSFSSVFQGMPQRSKWHMSVHVDHSIKMQEIAFLGKFKGTIAILQNGNWKLEVECHANVQNIQFKDDTNLSLDAGVFTIKCDTPFSYMGDYYSTGMESKLPLLLTDCDQDKVSVTTKECSTLNFISHFSFIPTDEMHFVDNYFDEE